MQWLLQTIHFYPVKGLEGKQFLVLAVSYLSSLEGGNKANSKA